MNPEGHEEIYRVAYQSATSELTDISAEFDRLRVRKDYIEKLILALKPLFAAEEQPQQSGAQELDESEQAEPAAETTIDQIETPVFNADPFQRRIDHVLGIGAGIRDVRKYSRQF